MRRIRPARRFGTLRPLDSVRLRMSSVAREVYGDRADWPNSSLTAFAYLYRRFGPPPCGTDERKRLGGAWILKTRDPDIYLSIDPGGGAIGLFFGQYASERLHVEAKRPRREWLAAIEGGWKSGLQRPPRCPPEIVERALAAHRHLLGDLLRPVYVRDVPINLFGRITAENPARGREAPRSRVAGWGVPVREMKKGRGRYGPNAPGRTP